MNNMSSSWDVSTIASLNSATSELNRYFAPFILLFGTVGNIVNALVLSQKTLRSNPCTWLFLVSSIFYCISIVASLSSRILSTWKADLSTTDSVLCKLRAFILFNSATIAAWLIALATVDRWLSSSTDANRRRQSTLRNAQRGMILIVVVSSLIETQKLYCYEANLTNTPIKCYTKNVACGIVSDLSLVLITILIPLVIMIMFGLMIISNVRQTQSRLQPMSMMVNSRTVNTSMPTTAGHQHHRKRIDRQLLIMLFVQVSLIVLFTLPLATTKLYSTLTRDQSKSALQNATESFTLSFFFLVFNIASGMPFYIYTLSGGKVFRRAVFTLMKSLALKMVCRHI